MNTASAYLTVAGIGVDVIYKDIKNLHVGVYPPVGRVRVAAPLQLNDEQVRLALVQRLPWIKRQRAQLQSAERQTEREMVTGESHFAWGRRYRLEVTECATKAHVDVAGDRLVHRPGCLGLRAQIPAPRRQRPVRRAPRRRARLAGG